MESLSRISNLLESGKISILLYTEVMMELGMYPVPGMSFLGLYADQDVARDLTLDAAQAARASSGNRKNLSTAQIKKLLDSRNEREVLDGLRRVTSVRDDTAHGTPPPMRQTSLRLHRS